MRHIKAEHEINLEDVERLPTERIKIPRKKRPDLARQENAGNIELAKVTDPSVALTDEESSKVYSKFAGKGLDGQGGTDVTIKTVDWGDFDVEQIVELLVLLGEKLSDKTLFEYQKVHVRRIFRSVLKCEGARLSTLFSRQSGKTETTAIAVVTLCVAIPSLAQKFPDQLGIFKSGFRVGVFGPNTMQAKNIFERVTSIAKSESAREVYEDPDIGTDIEKHGCKWSNGSFVRMQTADPKASIEGLSLDLIVLDEIQDMEDWVINKSILPMGAWNNASVVSIGTTNDKAGYFYNLIQTNKMADMRRALEDRRHSEFDYRTVIKYNPRYAAFVEQEKAENGVQSKHFQMNFCLKWLFEDGSAVSDSSLKEYAMKKFTGFTSYTIKEPVVVGIDIGSEINSTVVTVGKIVKGAEIEYDDVVEKKSVVQICDWYELEGLDYPTQRALIKAYLERYKNIVWIAVDETGVGKSALQEMKKEWRGFRNIEGFLFNPKSKAYLRSLFEEYLYSYRIVVPSTPEARTSEKWQKWYLQMVNLQKVTKAGHVCFEKKQTIASARDDYPDSFFLMLHAASQAMRNNAAAEVTSFEDLVRPKEKGAFEEIRKKAQRGELGVKNNLRASRVRKLLKGVI